MIPFDQQLRAIVAAVSFASPERARVTNLNGAQRDIAVAGERDAFGGLAAALYTDQYCLLPASAQMPSSETSAAFLSRLRAANPVAQRHQDGWTITQLAAGGLWISDAAQQPRFATLNEIVPLANAVAPGLPVRLVPQREFVTAPAGHYIIFGRPGFDPQTGRQIRFYWNLTPDGAAIFLREIGARLERRRIPFQAKVPVDPSGYARTDCGVLYLNDEDVEAAGDAIAATYRALRDGMRPSVPMFAREIAPGLAFAESPPTRESFGVHRCGLVAEGLLWAEQRGARDLPTRLAILRDRLIAYGLDLDRLERNPTSRYPYRLERLMDEQAA
ncbi:T3SS effector HopA1 family protein [Bradyrhizobium sp.]|uniref:T3SS effector HopA1 family protein n=1 Tax=Bradyrhizobium sp. TaxID=376 RepID=UPI003C19AB1A